jgi:hypothetical protein
MAEKVDGIEGGNTTARRKGSVVKALAKVSSDRFTPKNKPHYVGKPLVCSTCALKGVCVEARKMDEGSKAEFVCEEYSKE